MGARIARRRGGGPRWASLALRALVITALSLSVVARLQAPARAADPTPERSRYPACDPCVTIVDAPAWDELVTVVDQSAYDEVLTVVDVPAWDETVTVVDRPAFTDYRTVVDQPAQVIAHHDLLWPETTLARSVLVTPAHTEAYSVWVSSGYASSYWVDTSHSEYVSGYYEYVPGYTTYEPGYWAYEPGHYEYQSGYWDYSPGYWDYSPGYWEYSPGYWEYEPGHWEYESGYWSYECDWSSCYWSWNPGYSYWVSGYSYWVSGYSYWVSGYSYWVSGYSYWVPGYSYWVPGYSYWVSGYSYWVSGYSYWVPGYSTWVSSGYWASSWVDTSHYETAYRDVDDGYATVYEVVPAVYDDWIELIPEVSHEEAYTVAAITHDETVHHDAVTHEIVIHHDAVTHLETVHHEALTHQEQVALTTESRQGAVAADAPTATPAPSTVSALIVIPVVSTLTLIDAPAYDEAVTVVDAPAWDEVVTVVDSSARTETRTVVDAPATTVQHHDLLTPEGTVARQVLVSAAHLEPYQTYVTSGYWGSETYQSYEWTSAPAHYTRQVAAGCAQDDDYNYYCWPDHTVTEWLAGYWAYVPRTRSVWVDTTHWETTYRSVPDEYATVYDTVPAVYRDWVEEIPARTHEEAIEIPAVTHTEVIRHDAVTHQEVVHHAAVTHQETLRYDAIVDRGGTDSESSDQLADLALLLGLTALAGAGRYASKLDALKDTASQWAAAGHALPGQLVSYLSGDPADGGQGVETFVDTGALLGAGSLVPGTETDPGSAVQGITDRLARIDALVAPQMSVEATSDATSTDPWAAGGLLDESTRLVTRATVAAREPGADGTSTGNWWDVLVSKARATIRDGAYAIADTGNTAAAVFLPPTRDAMYTIADAGVAAADLVLPPLREAAYAVAETGNTVDTLTTGIARTRELLAKSYRTAEENAYLFGEVATYDKYFDAATMKWIDVVTNADGVLGRLNRAIGGTGNTITLSDGLIVSDLPQEQLTTEFALLRHEAAHTRQASEFGGAYLPVYEALWIGTAIANGQHPFEYTDVTHDAHPMEIDANTQAGLMTEVDLGQTIDDPFPFSWVHWTPETNGYNDYLDASASLVTAGSASATTSELEVPEPAAAATSTVTTSELATGEYELLVA